ncbi:hypothetical protein R5R35_014743 [Gryllus longicercus]|uniref:Major facilitator superfamily (MFS) profile domain-containing protein n=1 Tax=Gryllus longicercus TaxID=2509291 RepID=A0AAN9Z761_9ORTH
MDSSRVKPYFLAACSVTLLYLSSGALTGWASPALPRLRAAEGGGVTALSPAQQSWVAALAHLAHAAAALPAAALADRAGRHPALLLAAAPFLAAWALTALAGLLAPPPPPHDQGAWPVVLPLLLAARVAGGAGAGAAYTVGAMYLGEVAADGVRGAVGTLFQLALNAGVMLEFCLGPYVGYAPLAAASAAAPALFLATFALAPESPYYLLMKGEREAARAALARLRGARAASAAVEAELAQMARTVAARAARRAGLRDLLAAPCNQRALCVCVGLYTTALLSGHVVVLSYATRIFQLSRSALDADVCAVALGAVQIVTSVASSGLVDVAGRRPLLMASCAGCAASLAAEGAYFYAGDAAREAVFWLPLAALLCFLVSFTLGLGSVPGAILSEVFHTDVKAAATAFISMYHALMSFCIVKFMMAPVYELHLMFWCFSAFCTAGIFFVWFLVPETKGKTLLEVHYELQNGFVMKEISPEKETLISPVR